jgi:RecB family exonuclease
MAFSPSKIKLYEQCPLKYKFIYIDKLPEPPNPHASRGTMLHAELENAMKDGLPLLSENTQWLEPQIKHWKELNAESEMIFAVDENWQRCEMDNPKALVRGIIDLFYKDGVTATVRDFKSGKQRDYSDQVKLYATVIMCIMPEIEEVQLRIDYLDLKKTERYESVTREQLPELRAYFQDKMDMVGKDTIFAPNPSYLCKWCNFRKSNGGACQW